MRSDKELQQSAKAFIQEYKDTIQVAKEKGNNEHFWENFIKIFVPQIKSTDIKRKKPITTLENNKKHGREIDIYIPYAKVIIEQKCAGKDLDKKYLTSGGIKLTPFEQAKLYNDNLKYSQKARYIITSNFLEFRIYDMKYPTNNPFTIKFDELEKHIFFFRDLFDTRKSPANELHKQQKLSFRAGILIKQIQDELIRVYIAKRGIKGLSEQDYKSINMFLTRLVFCFYAEDSGVFPIRDMFGKYLKKSGVTQMRDAVLKIFEMLRTKEKERDKFTPYDLLAFPYTNGNLFEKDDRNIPQFSEQLGKLIVDEASFHFNWSLISPTIFGGLFESTLSPITRRSSGMHYTSIENIEKLIYPLFLDDLEGELDRILSAKTSKNTRDKNLINFQKKLGALTFFDPACGSGNFLTQTFIRLRELENKVIKKRFEDKDGDIVSTLSEDFDKCRIYVNINNFYGIEINDFATAVAKSALHIADKQMCKKTSEILRINLDYLPLREFKNIKCANALTTHWQEVCPNASYIIGNPPFIGAMIATKEQKTELLNIFGNIKGIGELDYVSAWFVKAKDYMLESQATKAAFVATSSICQGEQVALLWKRLFKSGINIDFARTSFKWDNSFDFGEGKKQKSDKEMAAVHVIIAGFSLQNKKQKYIFNEDCKIEAKNINGYLVDAPNICVENRSRPLCKNIAPMNFGNMPRDGGGLSLTEDERRELLDDNPLCEKWIKPYIGAQEFINNKKRYCLWLVDANLTELRQCKKVMKRIDFVKNFRSNSKAKSTRKFAQTPTLFCQITQSIGEPFIIVPRVSSERRDYIPMGFLGGDVIASDSTQVISNATLTDFGILTSSVHMAWMRAVAGRLGNGYRYSKDIVYNNFPFPTLGKDDRINLTNLASKILSIRTSYKSSLKDLYDPLTMPLDLRKAHQNNDKAILKLYKLQANASEAEIIKELFARYNTLAQKS